MRGGGERRGGLVGNGVAGRVAQGFFFGKKREWRVRIKKNPKDLFEKDQGMAWINVPRRSASRSLRDTTCHPRNAWGASDRSQRSLPRAYRSKSMLVNTEITITGRWPTISDADTYARHYRDRASS